MSIASLNLHKQKITSLISQRTTKHKTFIHKLRSMQQARSVCRQPCHLKKLKLSMQLKSLSQNKESFRESTVFRIPAFFYNIITSKNVLQKQIFTGFADSQLPFSTAMLFVLHLQTTRPFSAGPTDSESEKKLNRENKIKISKNDNAL